MFEMFIFFGDIKCKVTYGHLCRCIALCKILFNENMVLPTNIKWTLLMPHNLSNYFFLLKQ